MQDTEPVKTFEMAFVLGQGQLIKSFGFGQAAGIVQSDSLLIMMMKGAKTGIRHLAFDRQVHP